MATHIPVLSPGESVTFNVGNSDGTTNRETWTMGSKVVTAPDSTVGRGYEDIAFNLTIKNAGSTAIQGDPTNQASMVWGGTNGKTDDTVASTAGTNIEEGTDGLNGQDLELMSGIPAGRYASGYVELLVPTSPGAVAITDANTNQADLLINYDNLTATQLNG